jgi:hypothetical protein
MTADVRVDGGFLVVRVPLQTPTPSSTGKTLLVASTHGSCKTGCLVDGKPVTVSVNAYVGR